MEKEIYWLNNDSRTFLKRGYLPEGMTPEQRIKDMAVAADKYLEGKIPNFIEKFTDYLERGWYSISSPIWANFGLERGLPISCNGQYIADDTWDIVQNVAETAMMTKHGAGTSAYFGDIRPRGSVISDGHTTHGAVHFMQMFDKTIQVISQSGVRRGAFAAYYPVDGGDIEEFLTIRKDGHPIQDLSFGVTISDDFMQKVVAGDANKLNILKQIAKKRKESGYPYIFFTDTVNNNAADVYKDKKMKIHASNLCTEIALPANQEESFVCDLSSLNLYHRDEWEGTDAIEILIYFLDAVMTEYIIKTAGIPGLKKARNFAMRHRALGAGVLGWHSYLQSKMIPFESTEAKLINVQIWKNIREKSEKASRHLADLFGEPEVLHGYGRRNTTLLAVAPTVSSSFILGQISQGIEPIDSNYFIKDNAKIESAYKNTELIKLLEQKGKNNSETWSSILDNEGSVQHLDFLSDHEKMVFKTWIEISYKEILIQAAARQKYIDQAQSLNLKADKSMTVQDIVKYIIAAWKSGIKTLYYHKGVNASQKLAKELRSEKSKQVVSNKTDYESCVSCES